MDYEFPGSHGFPGFYGSHGFLEFDIRILIGFGSMNL